MKMLAAALLIAASPALADASKPPAETSLDMTQIMATMASLKSLDGYTKTVKDGQNEQAVSVGYQLGPGLRWVIAEDENQLQSAITDWQAMMIGLRTEHPGWDKKGSPEEQKYFDALGKAATIKRPVKLVRFGRDELKLDVNPIPPSILAGLIPVTEP